MEQFGRRVNGRTIDVEGVLYWAPLDCPQRRVTAIYHNELRSQLLIGDGDPDQYTHLRQKGKAPNDKTAFHNGQAYWGVSSANWPDVLWKFKPDETRHYATAPTWYHEGKLVISAEKQPMAIFPELPSVLSSKYEGAFIVAVLRQNSAITYEDLRSRMPSGSHKNKLGETSPIRINTLSQRASEFRNSKGLLSWDRGEPKRESYLSSLMTATQKQNNTIRGRAFTAVEKARLILIGQGSQPNRSRKAKGDETSDKRAAKSKAYKEKLLKQAKLDEEGLQNLRERFSSGPTAELSTILGGNRSVADRSAGNTSKEFESSHRSSHESSEEDSEDSSGEESSEEDRSEGDSHEDDRAAPPSTQSRDELPTDRAPEDTVMEDSEHHSDIDLLNITPHTIEDNFYISSAINVTVCEFHKLLGLKGQMEEIPNDKYSYRKQYEYLQRRFQQLWTRQQLPGPCPALCYRRPSLQTWTLKELQFAEVVYPRDH